MATPVLLDSEIEKGRILVKTLTREGFPFSAALWYLEPDAERYRLIVATPLVDEIGPLTAYRSAGTALDSIKPSERVSRDAVTLVSQRDPLISGLRLGKPLGSENESWLYSTPLPGAYFNEGYVYFVGEPVPMRKAN